MVNEQLLLVTAALVQFLKNFGVAGNWSMIAALLIGSGLAAAERYWPAFTTDALPILITGLVAAGLYDLAKSAGRGAIDRIRNGG